MLAKKFKLPIHEWLKRPKKTIIHKSDFFVIKFRANDFSFSRFGTVISAKISKSAVKRNIIKRIIFDFIRLNKYYKAQGRDILIIVLPKIRELKKNEIIKELEMLLNKFKIL